MNHKSLPALHGHDNRIHVYTNVPCFNWGTNENNTNQYGSVSNIITHTEPRTFLYLGLRYIFLSPEGSPHIWHPWGVRPPPKCRHHLPKQTRQGRTRHYPEYPTKGQLQRKRRDQGGDCGPASRWHAGETASRFCTIWGKASDWAKMMQQNFVWLIEWTQSPMGANGLCCLELESCGDILRVDGWWWGHRLPARMHFFVFFVTYKCSKTQLQLLMKHIGSNWLLLPSDYSAINKAAGKKKSALGVHKGFLFSLSLTADCREADLSQSWALLKYLKPMPCFLAISKLYY